VNTCDCTGHRVVGCGPCCQSDCDGTSRFGEGEFWLRHETVLRHH